MVIDIFENLSSTSDLYHNLEPLPILGIQPNLPDLMDVSLILAGQEPAQCSKGIPAMNNWLGALIRLIENPHQIDQARAGICRYISVKNEPS